MNLSSSGARPCSWNTKARAKISTTPERKPSNTSSESRTRNCPATSCSATSRTSTFSTSTENTEARFTLAALPDHIEAFGFIIGVQKRTFRDQAPVHIAASEKMGALHDALLAAGYRGHDRDRVEFLLAEYEKLTARPPRPRRRQKEAPENVRVLKTPGRKNERPADAKIRIESAKADFALLWQWIYSPDSQNLTRWQSRH